MILNNPFFVTNKLKWLFELSLLILRISFFWKKVSSWFFTFFYLEITYRSDFVDRPIRHKLMLLHLSKHLFALSLQAIFSLRFW